MLTSQLHPIPRRNIWYQCGVTAFLLRQKRDKQLIRVSVFSHVNVEPHMAKAATNSLYGAVETTPESSGHVTTHSQLPDSRYVYITGGSR